MRQQNWEKTKKTRKIRKFWNIFSKVKLNVNRHISGDYMTLFSFTVCLLSYNFCYTIINYYFSNGMAKLQPIFFKPEHVNSSLLMSGYNILLRENELRATENAIVQLSFTRFKIWKHIYLN